MLETISENKQKVLSQVRESFAGRLATVRYKS